MSKQLFPQILKPKFLDKSFQFRDEVDVYCPICIIEHKTHRSKVFRTTRSLYYHIQQFHQEHPDFEFVIQTIEFVTMAFQMKIIKNKKGNGNV